MTTSPSRHSLLAHGGCPVVAHLPELVATLAALEAATPPRKATSRLPELEAAMAEATPASALGGVLHVLLARWELLSVIEAQDPAAAAELRAAVPELLDRIERCLRSAAHAFQAAGLGVPPPVLARYADVGFEAEA